MANPAVSQLRDLLRLLLEPNNELIKQAEQDLKKYFADPRCISALLEIVGNVQDSPALRQLAAVFLRRRVSKQWIRQPPNVKAEVKVALVHICMQDQERIVRQATARVISVIAKLELAAGEWNELFQIMHEACHSSVVAQREMGMFLLFTVVEAVGSQLKPHFDVLFQLFAQGLQDPESRSVKQLAVQALASTVQCLTSDDIPRVQGVLGAVIAVIDTLLREDEPEAVKAMEIFDEFMDSTVPLVGAEMRQLLSYMLNIAANKEYEDATRVKALSFVVWASHKKKVLLKLNVLPDILNVICLILATPTEDDQPDDEENTPHSYASNVMDSLAMNLPPEKLFPQVFDFVRTAFSSADPHHRSAALVALHSVCNGCADHMRQCLPDIMTIVYAALTDTDIGVRRSAYETLAEFSEHLQENLCEFSNELFPRLFAGMEVAEVRGLACYAVDCLLDHAGDRVLP
eukprot:Colp12_sorted_trinity150504_noHs@13741